MALCLGKINYPNLSIPLFIAFTIKNSSFSLFLQKYIIYTRKYNLCQGNFLKRNFSNKVLTYINSKEFITVFYFAINSVILNIGINNEMTIPPIIMPKKPMTKGSIMLVNADTAASICSS